MNVAARSCHSVHEVFAQSIRGLVLHEQHYIVHFFYNVQHHQLYLFFRQNDSYLYMMRIYTKIVFEINVDWCFRHNTYFQYSYKHFLTYSCPGHDRSKVATSFNSLSHMSKSAYCVLYFPFSMLLPTCRMHFVQHHGIHLIAVVCGMCADGCLA